MDELIDFYKLLSDETRLRILLLLRKKKLCVCQIYGILDESQPKVSKHLSRLRSFGIIKDEKVEQFVYYYLNTKSEIYLNVLDNMIMNIEQYPKLKQDLNRCDHSSDYVGSYKCDVNKE